VGDQTREASNSISIITDGGAGHWVKLALHSRIASDITLDV
jgi:hypothetical protein